MEKGSNNQDPTQERSDSENMETRTLLEKMRMLPSGVRKSLIGLVGALALSYGAVQIDNAYINKEQQEVSSNSRFVESIFHDIISDEELSKELKLEQLGKLKNALEIMREMGGTDEALDALIQSIERMDIS